MDDATNYRLGMANLRATAEWIRDSQLRIHNHRGHQIICDLPTDQGGDNTGPTALELVIMSLAGCAVSIFTDVCKQSKIELKTLKASVDAQKQPGTSNLVAVNLKVEVSAEARKQLLEAAWRRTEANCPVLLIYQDPTPVKVQFGINK